MPTGRRSQLERQLDLVHVVKWMRAQPTRPTRADAARELNEWRAKLARADAIEAGASAEEAEALAKEAQIPEAVAVRQIRLAELHAQKASDIGLAEEYRRQLSDIHQAIEDSYAETAQVMLELYGRTIEVKQDDGSIGELTVMHPTSGAEDRDTLRDRLDKLEERRDKLRVRALMAVGGLEWERRERALRKALKASELLPEGAGRQAALVERQAAFLALLAERPMNPVTTQLVTANRDRVAGAVKLVQAMPAGGAGGNGAEPAGPARMVVEHVTVDEDKPPN